MESTGAPPPRVLFTEAVKMLQQKYCKRFCLLYLGQGLHSCTSEVKVPFSGSFKSLQPPSPNDRI
uniref:Uncharacterized protein n=1 Tax=Oryza brachyantha TaxID=4533 RepID=J3MT57_ORYBR